MQVALTYALVAIQIAENADHPRVTNRARIGSFPRSPARTIHHRLE
jgi:hypothetical protein